MRTIRMLLVLTVLAMAAVAAVAPAASASNCAEREIQLRGSTAFPGANGDARYRDCGRDGRDLNVQVEDINGLSGERLRVSVNGNAVGTMRVNRFGNAELELDTDDGEFVPMVQAGSTVRVRTLGGTLVARGSF